ncbi:hypothetical protein [Levilactobacillus yiduensis]|uniref:hypothetical protein n=1 Tax=Levilactobacillus yiduensis TaxID=2953880 RepID=UPI000EF2D455|nr:hypothetical protein [Levilactobacillus yiduensis]AYM01541.1 hypothetical protein D8911_00490 [Levilactobacillus brevis]
MKLTKWVTLVLLVGATGTVSPVTAQAKRRTSLTTFPRALRGTWYQDVGKVDGYHYYNGVRFTTHKFYFLANMTKNFVGSPLHARRLPVKQKMQHLDWVYATQKKGVIRVEPWSNRITLPLAGYYRRTTIKRNGRRVKVVQNVSANGKQVNSQYYATKKLARQFKVR